MPGILQDPGVNRFRVFVYTEGCESWCLLMETKQHTPQQVAGSAKVCLRTNSTGRVDFKASLHRCKHAIPYLSGMHVDRTV
jgi:hypothetical protein